MASTNDVNFGKINNIWQNIRKFKCHARALKSILRWFMTVDFNHKY